MQIGRYESRSLRRSTMSIYNADHAWLMLADGTTYEGRSFGAKGTAIGEVVFTTGMTGCQETLTDPELLGRLRCRPFR